MNLNEWAIRWGVSAEALNDLRRGMGTVPHHNPGPGNSPPESEAAVQARIRLEASRADCRLWRNNVGACYTAEGSFIRYGLANDSQKLNDVFKSSDLIGIRPVLITPAMVGSIIGQMLVREVKPEGWQFTGTARENGQLAFLQLILSLGGDAAFAASEGTI